MNKDKSWQLQEAKNKFSQLFEEAIHHKPQKITRRGKDAALLVSLQDYQKLLMSKKQTLSSFFQSAPLGDVELDIKRSRSKNREIEL